MLIRTKSPDDEVAVIDLSGRLDVASAMAFRAAVDDAVGTGPRHLVLNLIRLSGVDAAGLGELAHALDSVRAAGGELRLVIQSPTIGELLARTHLLGLFSVCETEAEAIASVESRCQLRTNTVSVAQHVESPTCGGNCDFHHQLGNA